MTRERIVIENRWHCPYCDAFYAEYVNGCPRCWLVEVGTSTSVVCVKAVLTYDGWRKATEAASPRSKPSRREVAMDGKCCGTCRYRVRVEDLRVRCDHPVTIKMRIRGLPGNFPDAIGENLMSLYDGTDCPCHEPKESEAT